MERARPDPRFEAVEPRHARQVQALVEHDRTILENTRMPDPYPSDGAREFIARMDGERERAWAMLEPAGQVAGMCGIILHEDHAEIGYWVGAPFRGRGYATAGAREMVRVATEELGYRTVRAQTRASNAASRRVLERAGLELVEIRPNGDKEPHWPAEELMAHYRLELD